MKNIRIRSFFKFFCATCLIFASFTSTSSRCCANLYQAISKENLKSLSEVEKNIHIFDPNKTWEEYLEAEFNRYLNPDPGSRRRSALTLLSQFEEKNPLPQTNVLDKKTWVDLEMLCGTKSNTSWYLASQLDRTVTEIGKMAFYRKLISPQHDIKQIKNQQAVVAHLIRDESLFNELDEKLKALVEPENLMLSYWYGENFYHYDHEKIELPFASKIAPIKDLEDWCNKSPLLLQARDIKSNVMGTLWKAYSFYLCVAGLIYGITSFDLASCLPEPIYNLPIIPKMKDMGNFTALPMWCIPVLGMIYNEHKRKEVERISKEGLGLWSKSHQIYSTIRNLSAEDWGDLKRKYDYAKVVRVAHYMNNLKEIVQLVSKNEELAERMPSIKSFNEHLAKLEQTSKDLHYLLELLGKKTFDGNYSPQFMYWGRVKVALDLIANLKNQFIDAMIVAGEIDAQLSIAKIYKEFKDKRVTFCFPTYIDPTTVDSPSVKSIDFWNPSIDSETVIPSSLEAGRLYEKPQGVIITGPNAGGKSTITRAFILSVVLAQSLGIAPAKEMELTPFNKIITYINITDDIAAGESHFKAGVLRAREVVKTFDNLQPHEFGLTAVDEVFNGTTVEEGQAAAYSFIKILGEYRPGMCITNTHFKIITTLEQLTGHFMNYKISVIDRPDEKIQYPFKLEYGISDQNVAFKILKEEGFSDKFLDQAQQALDDIV